MSNEELFLADDFFFGEDDTVEVVVEARGRQIPFKVKRGINSSDITAAKKKAITIGIGPNGAPVVKDIDEGAFEDELLFRCIKGWPFKESDGKQVQITRENVSKLSGDVAQALSQKILIMIQKGKEALVPFVKPSEGPS